MQFKKLIEKLLRYPADIEFEKIVKVVEYFGWEKEKGKSGSHFLTYYKEGESPLVIPVKNGRKVKREYIKRVCDRLNLEEWYEKEFGD